MVAWSSCSYFTKDGDRNPDLVLLEKGQTLVPMAQSSLYNAFAYVLSSSKPIFAQRAVLFIDTWFLNPATVMNPNLRFGQVVRGPPGTQEGSFMGVLDARSFVQVINAVMVLKLTKAPDWTIAREQTMLKWVLDYTHWMIHSDQGRKSGMSPKYAASCPSSSWYC